MDGGQGQMADVVVLGAGPAGLSCALFIAKAGRKVVVVDTNQTIIKRANLRNYLGFPEGLAGRELLVRGRSQVEQFGGTVINGRPVTVERSARGFVVRIGKELVKTTYMVLATGMSFQLAEQMGAEILRGNQVQATRIVRTDPEGRTSLPGVWACGVVAGMPVQAIVAAGDGARVAVHLLTEIRGSTYVDHDIMPSARKQPTVDLSTP